MSNTRSFRSTTEWGPAFWFVLHTSSLAYPIAPTTAHMRALVDFLIMLPNLLPCPVCQQHARDYISKANLQATALSRDNLFDFYVNFHNAVNQRLGKYTISISQARNMYSVRTSGWGPSFWFFLHMTALTFKDQPSFIEQSKMRQFLETFHIMLPTTIAQQMSYNYTTKRRDHLIWACLNKTNLFYFWFTFHNYINKTIGKEELSFERVKDLYRIN